MKRGGPLKRSPLKRAPFRPKRKVSAAEFHPSVKAAIRVRSGGHCEAHTPDCNWQCDAYHHRQRRSRGGMGTVDNGLLCCRPCHEYIHQNPEESYSRGWLIRSS